MKASSLNISIKEGSRLEIQHVTHPKQMSPLVLAFLGDAVFDLMVRARLVERGNAPIGQLHRHTVEHVCAAAQARGAGLLRPLLTEEEEGIYKRGRNTHNNTPKNADPAQYRSATGLEALFGYLYILGQTERAQFLFDRIWENLEGEETASQNP